MSQCDHVETHAIQKTMIAYNSPTFDFDLQQLREKMSVVDMKFGFWMSLFGGINDNIDNILQ